MFESDKNWNFNYGKKAVCIEKAKSESAFEWHREKKWHKNSSTDHTKKNSNRIKKKNPNERKK